MERSLFVFNSLKLRVERHPLLSPAFLRLWLGLSIYYLGDQFTTMALLWFVLQLLQIYALALLAGALSPATGADVRVILPYLVPEGALERANALASTSLQFASLLGPALAGILVAEVGGAFALLIDAMSFLLMGFLIFSLPPIARHTFNEASPVKQTWLSGFDLLVRTKETRLLTSLSVLFFFSYGPLEAALPLYSDKILYAGVQG